MDSPFEDPIRKYQPLCIEKNICKKNASDKYYIHKRLPDFTYRIDSGIQYHINISHNDFVVPDIVHFIQFTKHEKNEFEFHHMLSVLSAYKHQKPDRIYFWLDQEPDSEYWVRLKKIVPMYLIIRERPTSIRGCKIHYITKVSNVIRMEVLIEYGGMYFDLDILVLKSFNPLRRYDFTMGRESSSKFCNAVLVSKPWSDFLRVWHQHHVTLNESVWTYHSGKVPYLLSVQFPWMIHVEETSFFTPSHFETEYLYTEGQLFNWRESQYCVHLWIRFFRGRRRTDADMDTWNTTAGELYRYILYDDWRIRNKTQQANTTIN